jgi:hypothetical protein
MSNICQFLPNLQAGGAEKVAINLANEWHSNGHKVDFLLMKKTGRFLKDVHPGIEILSLDCERIRQVPLLLNSFLRKKDIDIFIVHMWPLTSAAVLSWLLAFKPCKIILM